MLTVAPVPTMAGNLDMLGFYVAQSWITDPGAEAILFDRLPSRTLPLARAAGSIAIPVSDRSARIQVHEVRTVAAILRQVQSCDQGPRRYGVRTADRFRSCARDRAVLLCSMLRHKGVPARTRCGFARYLETSICAEHWVCEYWHDWEQRWVLVDPWLAGLPAGQSRIDFSSFDVPRTWFYPAGRAWQMCRIWGADSGHFGLAAGMCGLPYIASQLVRDLACLNSVEIMPWDAWGLGKRAFQLLSEDDLPVLDTVAALTLAGNKAFSEILATYRGNADLRVPSWICGSETGPVEHTLVA